MAEILFALPDFDATKEYYIEFLKELDGVTYSITLQYAERMKRYIMSIGDKVKGVPVSAGMDLIQNFQYPELEVPPGKLDTFDFDGLNRDPQKETFGSRITLRYTEIDS